jgi:hypothetical protein
LLEGIQQGMAALLAAVLVLAGSAFIQRDEPQLQQDIGRQTGRAERAEAQIRNLEDQIAENRAMIRALERRLDGSTEATGPPSGSHSSTSDEEPRSEPPKPRDQDPPPKPKPSPPPSPSPDCPPIVGCLPTLLP